MLNIPYAAYHLVLVWLTLPPGGPNLTKNGVLGALGRRIFIGWLGGLTRGARNGNCSCKSFLVE